MKGWNRQANIFLKLGNTAGAYAAATAAFKFGLDVMPDRDPHKGPSGIVRIRNEFDFGPLATKRHPDPSNIEGVQIIDPALQVRGAWKKLKTKETPPSRLGFASLLWKGEQGLGPLLIKSLTHIF